MKHITKIFAASLLAFLFAGNAWSGIIYDGNDNPNQQGGVNFGDFAYADDFIIGGEGSAVINDAHFYTLEPIESSVAERTVYYAFYDNAVDPQVGDVPGDILALNIASYSKAPTGVLAFGDQYVEYEYSFDLVDDLLVDRGSRYWFTVYIVNATDIFWETANSTLDPNTPAARGPRQLNGPWAHTRGDLAFYLTGNLIPVPGPLPLLLLGGGLLALRLRRR